MVGVKRLKGEEGEGEGENHDISISAEISDLVQEIGTQMLHACYMRMFV